MKTKNDSKLKDIFSISVMQVIDKNTLYNVVKNKPDSVHKCYWKFSQLKALFFKMMLANRLEEKVRMRMMSCMDNLCK
jgi:hypothetical protein